LQPAFEEARIRDEIDFDLEDELALDLEEEELQKRSKQLTTASTLLSSSTHF
jgi:hypothetical protein